MNRIKLFALASFQLLFFTSIAQQDSLWHLNSSDAKEPGIDLQKADDFVKDKKSVEVIVAVIDDGVDVMHSDLQGMLWTNSKEVADNGIDDDGNGYIDDIYGWNFIGKTKGDNLEKARYIRSQTIKFKSMKGSEKKANGYKAFKETRKSFKKEAKKTKRQAKFIGRMDTYMDAVQTKFGSTPTLKQVKSIRAKKFAGKTAKLVTKKMVKKSPESFNSIYSGIHEGAEQLGDAANYHYNVDLDERKKNVGDNYEDINEKYYGDNNVNYHSSGHGTHVAGIIAANRNNDFGAKGICTTCKIMTLRTVPNGDERDKDVANSIRYAVDNGAKVLNMSFGKDMSPNASAVTEAIKYAESKDVLLVHAAGNDASNNDLVGNYPNDSNSTGSNWLEIGASSYEASPMKIADFSNYGKNGVDLFAPGHMIYSTYHHSGYGAISGTSMASPVVAGVAAYVRSYYPSLSAAQVKEVLMKSTTNITDAQKIPGTKDVKSVSDVSVSGGIVNLYKALLLAEEMVK
jgi:subtilisin family serine protease